MSKRTRRAARLADVAAAAVTCGRCRTRFTFPLPNLATAFLARDGGGECWCCPHCHALVVGEGAGAATRGPFNLLLAALNTLAGLRDKVEVRLVFRRPQGDEGGAP
jgi:hypothetical protein